MEEQKRRAEADKLAAITELEQRSREFLQEKEEKKRLEAKIEAMQSQLLIGGNKLEDSHAFRCASTTCLDTCCIRHAHVHRTLLAREQRRIRDEYEARLQELERERTSVGQDRAQVAQYQALVVKQRDIMLALTQRLTERDDTVLGLQEEVEAYDSRVKYVVLLYDDAHTWCGCVVCWSVQYACTAAVYTPLTT